MKNLIVKFVEIFLAIILVGFTLAVVVSSGGFQSNLKLFSVATGSMEPAIKAGSMILVEQSDDYSPGDIVTFKTKSSSEFVATHRIIDTKVTDSKDYFVTKGDANPDNDSTLVSQDEIIGKEVFVIPFVGRITILLQTPIGVLLLVWIPSLVLIIGESISLGRHWGSKFRISKIKVLMILMGMSLYALPVSNAFLSDVTNLSNLSFRLDYREPEIEMTYDVETSMFSFKIKNAKFVTNVQYEVLYDDDSIPQAVSGDKNNSGDNVVEESVYLGSCSSEVCTPHDPDNITLNLILTYGNGETSSLTQTYDTI